VEPLGVEREDPIDGEPVLVAGLGGRDVVAHVGGRDHERALRPRRRGDGPSDGTALRDGEPAQAERRELDVRARHLEERDLDLEGVLAQVGGAVELDERVGCERVGERRRDGDRAERRAPAAARGPERGRAPEAGVVRAEHDDAGGHLHARVDRAGDRAGVDVAGVGGHHSDGAGLARGRGEPGGDLPRERVPLAVVEPPRDRRFTVHGRPGV
jgi:hypothetical protein